MKNKLFHGIMPALITPFDEQGNLKKESVRRIMERELKSGIQGFYINGNTGEGLFLSETVRRELAEIAMDVCKGRAKVINHVGAVDPQSAIRLAKHARELGCDAISSLVPNYISTYSDQEVLDYYKRLSDVSSLPVLVYCTGLLKSSPVQFMEKAIKTGSVIGTKFTMYNYYHMHQITQLNGGDITVINGPDEMVICGLTMGADGGIGSTYNVMPEKFVALYNAFRAGEYDKARQIQFDINEIIHVLLTHGANGVTASIKEVFNIMGYDAGNVAYPGKVFSDDERAAFIRDMEKAGYHFDA